MFDYGELRNSNKSSRRESLSRRPSNFDACKDIVYTRVSSEIIEVTDMKTKNVSKSPCK